MLNRKMLPPVGFGDAHRQLPAGKPHRYDQTTGQRILSRLDTPPPQGQASWTGGSLAEGAPADITILDPDRAWIYDVNRSFSKSRNTPFHGHAFRGGPVATIVNGSIVWSAQTL